MLLALNHESIPMKWDTNLNLPHKVLVYVFGDHQLPPLYKGREVTRESLANIVEDIKLLCLGMYAEFFPCLFKFFLKNIETLYSNEFPSIFQQYCCIWYLLCIRFEVVSLLMEIDIALEPIL